MNALQPFAGGPDPQPWRGLDGPRWWALATDAVTRGPDRLGFFDLLLAPCPSRRGCSAPESVAQDAGQLGPEASPEPGRRESLGARLEPSDIEAFPIGVS
jgi:hypothetical protein